MRDAPPSIQDASSPQCLPPRACTEGAIELGRPRRGGETAGMSRVRLRLVRALVVLAAIVLVCGAAGPGDPLATKGWGWPTDPVQVVRPFEAPAHAYGPGHRGLDLTASGSVHSPADGRIAFAGEVAGRAVVTIDHGDGLVTTLEPVTTELAVGDAVARGAPVGVVSTGGHTGPGEVHFGVRLDGVYVNPLRLLGGVPRAVLLPCC